MAQTFSATVSEWARKSQDAALLVFKESAEEVVHQLTEELTQMIYMGTETEYRRTGFLRASLRASTTAMPVLSLDNPGGTHTPDFGMIELVIEGAGEGDTIYLGYTARYGAYVHYGANGRPGRPWVDMVAQKWPTIVQTKAAEIKARLGL